MRKLLILTVVIMTALSLGAVSVDLGLSYGGRNLADDDFKDIFGNGNVFCPELSVNVFKGLTLGVLMETGYDKDGQLGNVIAYKSNLKVSGFEAFIGYTLDLKRFHPFIRLGYGSYKYEQTIDATHLPSEYTNLEETKSVVTYGGGIKVDLIAGLYLGGQVRYVPMKLTPVENEIDLGGLRYLVTVGYRFDFKKKE